MESLPRLDETQLVTGAKTLRETYNKRKMDPREVWGLRSGFDKLDKMTGGWQKGHLAAIGGRTHHGKTALMNQMACNGAEDIFEQGVDGMIYLISPELQSADFILRMAGIMSRVETSKIQSGMASDQEEEDFFKSVDLLTELHETLHLYAGATVDIAAIRQFFEEQHMLRKPITGIYIDYLTYLKTSQFRDEYQAASHISRTLSELAVELQVPIIVGAQLKREFESRGFSEKEEEKAPILSDFSSSGKIETDAAEAVMINNPPDDLKKMKGLPQACQLYVRKNRSTGRLGHVDMIFDNRLGAFRDTSELDMSMGL